MSAPIRPDLGPLYFLKTYAFSYWHGPGITGSDFRRSFWMSEQGVGRRTTIVSYDTPIAWNNYGSAKGPMSTADHLTRITTTRDQASGFDTTWFTDKTTLVTTSTGGNYAAPLYNDGSRYYNGNTFSIDSTVYVQNRGNTTTLLGSLSGSGSGWEYYIYIPLPIAMNRGTFLNRNSTYVFGVNNGATQMYRLSLPTSWSASVVTTAWPDSEVAYNDDNETWYALSKATGAQDLVRFDNATLTKSVVGSVSYGTGLASDAPSWTGLEATFSRTPSGLGNITDLYAFNFATETFATTGKTLPSIFSGEWHSVAA